jgi:hypothetical protein
MWGLGRKKENRSNKEASELQNGGNDIILIERSRTKKTTRTSDAFTQPTILVPSTSHQRKRTPNQLLILLVLCCLVVPSFFYFDEKAWKEYMFEATMPLNTDSMPTLLELVGGGSVICPNGTFAVEDTILPTSITTAGRKIPKIVHMTGPSRCVHPHVFHAISMWRFENHSLYFHDDAAMFKLLERRWPEFPHLQLGQQCMTTMANRADVWRYLLIWQFGGIYTDIDNGRESFVCDRDRDG